MSASGTLGYGAPGLYPGFQGFGLGYHRGYGYGGDALGVGAEGGYPFYGGPGYPHPWPCLRRCGRINPFPYYGGPGFPSADCPHYFGAVGPLVADQPVITIGSDFDQSGGYGMFTGVLPYSEAYLAPYTTSAAAEDSPNESSSSYPSTPSTNPAPALREVPPSTTTGRSLGIEAEPVVEAGGVAGLKVTKVYPESVAEKAGLHAGDVIHSINGYLTQQPGNLAWIIAHAAPDNVLMMNVHTTSAAREQTLRAQLP
jgi:membrane-associated protease RseP (regulator of RpoE activity)